MNVTTNKFLERPDDTQQFKSYVEKITTNPTSKQVKRARFINLNPVTPPSDNDDQHFAFTDIKNQQDDKLSLMVQSLLQKMKYI